MRCSFPPCWLPVSSPQQALPAPLPLIALPPLVRCSIISSRSFSTNTLLTLDACPTLLIVSSSPKSISQTHLKHQQCILLTPSRHFLGSACLLSLSSWPQSPRSVRPKSQFHASWLAATLSVFQPRSWSGRLLAVQSADPPAHGKLSSAPPFPLACTECNPSPSPTLLPQPARILPILPAPPPPPPPSKHCSSVCSVLPTCSPFWPLGSHSSEFPSLPCSLRQTHIRWASQTHIRGVQWISCIHNAAVFVFANTAGPAPLHVLLLVTTAGGCYGACTGTSPMTCRRHPSRAGPGD